MSAPWTRIASSGQPHVHISVDASYEVPPEMGVAVSRAYASYVANPSIPTAKRLAEALGRPVPDVVPTPTAVGIKRPRSQRGGNGVDAALLRAYAFSDMLHDLVGIEAHAWPVARQWLLTQCAPHIRGADVPTHTLNDKLARAWVRASGMRWDDLFRKARAGGEDGALVDVLQSWASQEKLSIVMDGVLGQAFETMVETALFLLMVHGGSKVLRPRLQTSKRVVGQRIRELTILDGFFQEMDRVGSAGVGFLSNYANALSKAFGGAAVAVWRPTAPLPPRFLMGYHVTPDGAIGLPDGSRIEYHPDKPWRYGQKKRVATAAGIYVPYKKSALREMCEEIFDEGRSPTQEEAALLERAALLNFFRDAYKADIALQHHAIFWTHDRLAFVFFRMLQELHGIPSPKGMYMNPFTDEYLVGIPT